MTIDLNPTGIGPVEQSEDVKQSALAASGRPNDGVHSSGLKVERDAAQRVDTRFLLPEEALHLTASKQNVGRHEIDVTTCSRGERHADASLGRRFTNFPISR